MGNDSNNFYGKLLRDIKPYFKKDRIYFFEFDTNLVYMVDNYKLAEYPLRQGLAGYLWLCLYEPKYFEKSDSLIWVQPTNSNTGEE